jgi:glutathione peroxidase
MNFYSLKTKTPSGEMIDMSQFEGKTVLIINTATKCGLTPQFKGLEDLHQKHKADGLVVIGFPCNQFLSQEPLTNKEMTDACRINHGVTFQLTEKVDVNGSNTHPVFAYLKKELSTFFGGRIKWNFTKFLIAPNGEPYKRYSPSTLPEKIEKDIQFLLSRTEKEVYSQ